MPKLLCVCQICLSMLAIISETWQLLYQNPRICQGKYSRGVGVCKNQQIESWLLFLLTMPCMPFCTPQSQSAPKVQLRSTLLASNSLKIAGKNWFVFVPPKATGSLFLFHTEDMSYTSLENISMIINDMQIMHMTYYIYIYICSVQ